MSDIKELTNTIKISIKSAFAEIDWWSIVQKDVQSSIFYIVDNIEYLGPNFRESFRASAAFKFKCRELVGKNLGGPGVLFGDRLTEDAYQSSINVVKLLLGLDDWVMPNEADVQACIKLCDQVDSLEVFGVLKSQDTKNSLPNIAKEQFSQNIDRNDFSPPKN